MEQTKLAEYLEVFVED